MTTPNPTPGFAPATVNSTQWDTQVQEANARAMQDAAAYRAQDPNSSGFLPDFIEKPVEWVGSKLHQVYTNVVSRPIATAFIATELGAAEAKDNSQAWGNLFNGDIWDQAYKDSAHVSPGQAIEFGFENFFTGSSNEQLKKNLQAPVMAPVKNELGQPTGEKVNLNQTGYLWDNPQAVAERYDSGAQKWVSGGIDAASSWYLDPIANAGKAIGLARDVAYVRPALSTPNATFADMARGVLSGGRIGGRPATVDNIEKNLNSSAFTQMGNLIMKQKVKLGSGAEGGSFENWVTNQAWGKNAADTPALAAQLGKAADRSEVDKILGVAMGDQTQIQQLTAKNAELGAMAIQLDRQKKGLISGFSPNPDPIQVIKQQQQLSDISDQITSIASQQSDVSDKISLSMAMKNGMYFNPAISPLASTIGDYARKLDTIKASGFAKIPLTLAYNNLYVRPFRVATGVTFGAIRAPGHVDIFADNAHVALDGSLDSANVWTGDERAQLVSKFIAATPDRRGILLDMMDRASVGRIARKHGLTDDQASALYSTITGMKADAMNGRIYSTANIDLPNGTSIRADHVDDGGNVIAVHPILQTQLENTHIMTDYDKLNSVLKFNAGAFKKILADQEIQARAATNGPLTLAQMQTMSGDAAKAAAQGFGNKIYQAKNFTGELGNTLSRMWKFSALLRLGYGPRAIADDFMGQAARLGGYQLFMDRAAAGSRNMFFRTMAKTFSGDDASYQQMIASLESGITETQNKIAGYQNRIDNVNSYLPPAMNYTGKGKKGLTQFNQRTNALKDAQQKLDDANETLNQLRIQRNKVGAVRDKLGDQYVITPDGKAFPRPFEGPQGALFRDMNSDRATIDSMLGGTSSDIWTRYRTAGDWQVLTATTATQQQHLAAWARVVQHQLANDKAAQIVIKGGNASDLEKWFSKPEGNAYFQSLGLKNMSHEDLADRIEAEVEKSLPTHTPQAMALRQAVAEGANDKTVTDLMGKVNLTDRPSVQAEGTAYAMGKSDVIKHMDGVMSKWYDTMSRVPAEVLSRNPLFFSLYRQHVSDLWLAAKNQGVTELGPAAQQTAVETARKLALKDVKRFTYNMDFESKIAHQMRFVSPFWGPMQESFGRWGRIVADRPQVVAHAADIFTSPIRAGHAVDQNGNAVDADGYSTDPVTGKKTLVAKSDMNLQFQIPTWADDILNVDGGTKLNMPINTLNLVLQNDPWYNPGTGPWVQVPANFAALRANPKLGDTLQYLGILQSVKQNSLAQAGMPALPAALAALVGQGDTSQQQKDMLQIMQSEDYRYKTGMRSTEPTWAEVKDKAAHAANLRAYFKAILPVSTSFKDPYQFFRDRYSELQKSDPGTADQVFLAKYGDAAFAFTGALTKSGKGLPATAEAVMADKKFSYLTDQYPELAQLIVGPYSAGEYSNTAYQQQLMSGDRVKLTAQQSMDSAQANLGWAQFTKYMNIVTANLYQAGFSDFQQKGAESFNNSRKAVISMLSNPTLPNGTTNPYYNAQFSQQFNTIDRTKDARQAAVLNKIVTEKALLDDPMRTDIRSLQQYMVNRNSVQQVLGNRKNAGGSDDINANSNLDLKRQFYDATQSLIEGDTRFQALHDRFLVHDMFDHYDPALSATGA